MGYNLHTCCMKWIQLLKIKFKKQKLFPFPSMDVQEHLTCRTYLSNTNLDVSIFVKIFHLI